MSLEAQAWSLDQPISDPMAKLLLIMLANYSNEQHIATVSYQRLKTLCGFKSKSTLCKKLNLLEGQSVIQRIPQVSATGGTESNAYQLLLPTVAVLQPEPQPKPKAIRQETLKTPPPGLNVFAWELWLDYKKTQFNDRYKTPRSEQIAYNKLIQLADGDHDRQRDIVEQSIANTWKGLFPLQETRHGGQKQTDWRAGLAEVFAPDGPPEAGTGEIIIDADYLADTTPRRSLTGKALPHTPVVSSGLSDPGGFESHLDGICPSTDREEDQ